MPELPEVETVRRGLVPYLEGRVIERVEILDPRLVRPRAPTDISPALTGRRVERLERRGKWLVFRLSGGVSAVHHLRMTGSFAAPDQPEPSHVRMRYFVSGLDGPIRYNDPRRFGTLDVGSDDEIDALLDSKLGPEPLDDAWTGDTFHAAIHHRTAPLKAVLLDQKVVAGLGNIYVDEACFLAGVRPDLPADRLSKPRARRLVDAVKDRLIEAIAVGGSTLRDYRGVEGDAGGMQERFYAYGRAGKPCLVCGATMRGARVAGRSTSWCPHDQKG
ncbi:MAG: bifunctional DNA-formamidopyrimidine glycosylase/DNA-(apurinic or apyrimidinic site) lyase [Thermoleophilia bacterium]|nr:bifunctional DNA-formamidopyrimidine glycosylase/DNA-(apurinic or apyrimidinic site) lyase [Thermoleophilia bacterium]